MADTPVTGCPLSKLLPFIVLHGMFVVACVLVTLQTRCASCFDGVWLSCVTLGFTVIPSFVTAELTCHSFQMQCKVSIRLFNPYPTNVENRVSSE